MLCRIVLLHKNTAKATHIIMRILDKTKRNQGNLTAVDRVYQTVTRKIHFNSAGISIKQIKEK